MMVAAVGALMHELGSGSLRRMAAEMHGMVASAQLCHLADGFNAPDDVTARGHV